LGRCEILQRKVQNEQTKIKLKMTTPATLNIVDKDRIIEMAWEDRTTFEAIELQFGLKQQDVIKLMRHELKSSSFKLWRERTKGRPTKHGALRNDDIGRFKCSRQRIITHNKISKRK
jgi:uncharacterized protein (TIGR03643 family)